MEKQKNMQMSIFQNLLFSKEYIWTLHCICKDYYTFVFLVYASFLTIQNTFFPNILSTMKGKQLHKAYIHAYVCEILNADTHTNTYRHPYIYSLSEKYLLFFVNNVERFCISLYFYFFFWKRELWQNIHSSVPFYSIHPCCHNLRSLVHILRDLFQQSLILSCRVTT